MFKRLLKDESGTTAIEYGLIAMLVSVAAMAAFMAVGDSVNNLLFVVDNDVNFAADKMIETISDANQK